jgi:hypothetical protein
VLGQKTPATLTAHPLGRLAVYWQASLGVLNGTGKLGELRALGGSEGDSDTRRTVPADLEISASDQSVHCDRADFPQRQVGSGLVAGRGKDENTPFREDEPALPEAAIRGQSGLGRRQLDFTAG